MNVFVDNSNIKIIHFILNSIPSIKVHIAQQKQSGNNLLMYLKHNTNVRVTWYIKHRKNRQVFKYDIPYTLTVSVCLFFNNS